MLKNFDKVEKLGLPKRIYNLLIDKGFVYISDFKGKRSDFKNMTGLGEKGFETFIARVDAYENETRRRVF